jgi:hypothetical protein
MQLNSNRPVYGKEKAVKIGLTSKRFTYDDMNENARDAVENAKKKDRSDIDVPNINKCSWVNGVLDSFIGRTQPNSSSTVPTKLAEKT